MNQIDLPARPRMLVIALRRLGDVLLTTPLIRSLRCAWPEATIDVLVFASTAGVLEGNPDLDGIVAMPEQPTVTQSLLLAMRLRNSYALAVSTQCGDRPAFFACIAGRTRVGPVEGNFSGHLKRLAYHRSLPYEAGVHRVEEILRIVDLLGIPRVPNLICPSGQVPSQIPAGPFAVIHAKPMYRYKQWTMSGWRELAIALTERGLAVVATGGPTEGERKYLDELWSGGGPSVQRLDGRLTWAQLAELLAEARVFIGPDTSVTHLAAAAGCPTVALYGPTDPRLWGSWPANGLDSMWAAAGAVQHRGNIWLVQNALPCTPCQLEGCERQLDSYSQCLNELSPRQVIAAVDQALGS